MLHSIHVFIENQGFSEVLKFLRVVALKLTHRQKTEYRFGILVQTASYDVGERSFGFSRCTSID
jgi:hypothetical protein